MALGGGMYTVQNKVLPGAYINFVSAARASATLGDRGTAAFPLSLDWGPENEVVTIENSEFQKGSLGADRATPTRRTSCVRCARSSQMPRCCTCSV